MVRMAVYAIGDVQGCDRTLGRLLDRIGFDPENDRLWFAGDLVNRGPGSLGVLRRVRALGDSAVTVLGNHDLHLLARAAGVRERSAKDTLEEVLAAPDRDELLDWLRRRPLLHRDGDFVLVHAGLIPAWTVDEAAALAAEVEAMLRGPEPERLYAEMQRKKRNWDPSLNGSKRLAAIVRVMTRVRVCTEDGQVHEPFTSGPDEAPEGTRPWFDMPDRRSADHVLVTGHWAALGRRLMPSVLALDSGCIWGRELSAVRLDDRAAFVEPLAD
jgi:bis(5'-nucleosyl)-tetraphosphatase (symmetrical)